MAYDFAYARYLLSHLRQPERAFEAMVRALHPGGRLAGEDVFFPGHVCYPPNAAFDRYLDLYQAVARSRTFAATTRRFYARSPPAGLQAYSPSRLEG